MEMSVEQEIMSAVVRVDMFLVSAWKVMLVFGIMLLIILRRK